jgi:hypothetical protein
MHDHIIVVCQDEPMFVTQGRRQTLDQVEETVAPGSDVGAMLDVPWRPIPLGLCIVSFVEERIEPLVTNALFSSDLLDDIRPSSGRFT